MSLGHAHVLGDDHQILARPQQPRAAVEDRAQRFDELVVVGHGLQVAPGGAVVGIKAVLGAALVGRDAPRLVRSMFQ